MNLIPLRAKSLTEISRNIFLESITGRFCRGLLFTIIAYFVFDCEAKLLNPRETLSTAGESTLLACFQDY
jgi:hypothetical protein